MKLTEANILDPIYDALVATNERREWDGYIHVSDLHRCPMHWYRSEHLEELGYAKKVVNPSDAAVFMRGNGLHKEFQETLEKFGVLLAKEYYVQHRVLKICGHIDAIVKTDSFELPVVYEFKSMDPDKFRQLDTEPEPAHAFQAMMYAFLFNAGVKKDGSENLLEMFTQSGPVSFDRVFPDTAVVYFNTQYSCFKAFPVKFRIDIIQRAIDKVKHYFSRRVDGWPPTEYLKCDDEAKKCGNCRLNKKLVKEKSIV